MASKRKSSDGRRIQYVGYDEPYKALARAVIAQATIDWLRCKRGYDWGVLQFVRSRWGCYLCDEALGMEGRDVEQRLWAAKDDATAVALAE